MPNVFNLHVSFQSSLKINACSSQDSFAYFESRHSSYPQFPWPPLGTPGTPLFATNQQKKWESRSAKESSTNNISQRVGSSTETHVPYQSNKNVNANVENQTKS